ncbi:hypothetical protein ABWH96_11765 [Marivirga tractuosa]|uniref:hypothetical protein n=1 Tax=Marivirga tractuosa TaxID=1006 RepID=UPI0035D09D3E
MIKSEYWGKIYILCFIDQIKDNNQFDGLTELLIDNDFITEEFLPLTDQLDVKFIEDKVQLKQEILRLDNVHPKTIHFISHGSVNNPGVLCKTNLEYLDVHRILREFKNKQNIILNFMNVCMQNDIELSDFKHLFTTNLNSSMAVAIQPTSISLYKLYTLSKVESESFHQDINSKNYNMKY